MGLEELDSKGLTQCTEGLEELDSKDRQCFAAACNPCQGPMGIGRS